MNINVDTDIDLNIRKLDAFLEKLKLVEDQSRVLNFITIKQFSKIRNCSISTAQKIFAEPSFPSENYRQGKGRRSNSLIKLVYAETR